MNRPVLHVVIKQDYQAGCIVATKPIQIYLVSAMRVCNSSDKQPQILCIQY